MQLQACVCLAAPHPQCVFQYQNDSIASKHQAEYLIRRVHIHLLLMIIRRPSHYTAGCLIQDYDQNDDV